MLEFEYTSVFESFKERATLPREVREARREGSTVCVSVNVVGPRAPKVQKDKQTAGEHVPRPRGRTVWAGWTWSSTLRSGDHGVLLVYPS